jgi:hypothetical protein
MLHLNKLRLGSLLDINHQRSDARCVVGTCGSDFPGAFRNGLVPYSSRRLSPLPLLPRFNALRFGAVIPH